MTPTDVPAATAPTHCPNCQHGFMGEAPRFCPACGQETRVRPPTLGEFAQQFGGAYLSTEGALWRTLALLLTRPGELTKRYLAGQRKHYVLPLRLFLTISVIVLLLFRLVATAGLEEGQPRADAALEQKAGTSSFSISMGGSRAGVKDGQFFCNDLPDWVCRRIQRRLDTDPKGLKREVLKMGERIVSQLGSTMFVMLPAFALWLKLAYIDRRLRYTEHLVFALHLHAFWFLALALALPNLSWLTFIAFCAVPLYGLLSLKRVYGGGWPSLLLRAGVVSALYLMTLAAVMVGLSLWALLF